MRIRRTSLAVALYSRLISIAFTATDLPDPVVPATSRCGILPRSAVTEWPDMSLPSASVNGDFSRAYCSLISISDSCTISRRSFGTSIPMVLLPGMTSTTRTETNDKERAMSCERPVILLALIPGASCISKRVMTGPGCTATTSTLMRNSASFCSSNNDRSRNSSSVKPVVCGSGASSNDKGGRSESGTSRYNLA